MLSFFSKYAPGVLELSPTRSTTESRWGRLAAEDGPAEGGGGGKPPRLKKFKAVNVLEKIDFLSGFDCFWG